MEAIYKITDEYNIAKVKVSASGEYKGEPLNEIDEEIHIKVTTLEKPICIGDKPSFSDKDTFIKKGRGSEENLKKIYKNLVINTPCKTEIPIISPETE